jgi:protein-tyrosine phosphatase
VTRPSRQPLRFAVLAAALIGASISVHSGWAANEVAVAAEPVATGVSADTRLIALEGAANVRSIGGLVGSRGPIPLDSFIRAADLNRLTAADRDALAARGVALSVDLRTEEEARSSPNPLLEDPRFRYVRISLLGREKLDLASLPPSLGEMYVRALSENQPQFREVFSTMARQDQGAIVFHCTAGKDRTGMVAGLLLSLAGVPRGEIVSNYAESERLLAASTKLTPQMQEMLRQNPRIAALAGSPPEAMQSFLDSLETEHGGARAYLRTIGVNDLEIERLLRRLGQTPPK